MAKTALIIVGHKNIPQITSEGLRSWRSVSALKASTGGSSEAVFNWDQVMPKLRDLLIVRGIQVFITDAIYHKETYSRDYDCAILLHDDGGNTNNRSMSSAPLRGVTPPYLNPGALTASEKFATIWNKKYPEITGTINTPAAVTAAMRENYAFDYIGMDTPAILVEHFNRDSQKGKDLRANPDLVAKGDAEAIFEFLGLSSGPTEPSTEELKKKIKELEAKLAEYQQTINNLQQKINKAKIGIDNAKSALA